MKDRQANQNGELPQSQDDVPVKRFGDGIREKLIGIFIAIKVIPLIVLAVFAAREIAQLGETFKEKSNETVAETSKLVQETGALASKSSIAALDLKSRESIERLTVDIAGAVADFLYSRDNDIRQAADLPITEEQFRKFLAIRSREVVSHRTWVLDESGTRWRPGTEETSQPTAVAPGSPNNRKDFHYQPSHHDGIRKQQPLYHEMTFVGLDGKEKLKVTATELLPKDLRDISHRENTWCRAETYFSHLSSLEPGEIYVSAVIGEYLPSPVIGPYTRAQAEKAGIDFAPEKAAYAGKENPVGKRFQGLVRWGTPVYKGSTKIGYITLALDHRHLMEFTDHVVPTPERFSDISDAGSGNYAFMWDAQARNICHPRNYFITGYDPKTGEPAVPWLSSEMYKIWQSVNGSFAEFEKIAPRFFEQTIEKHAEPSLTKAGMLGLDCRYLNFAPQCIGWYNLTEHGGSGSFLILWSDLWKLTTAAAIPYYTGDYGASPRGFGFVTIGANVDEFHSSATETAARITAITKQYEDDLEQKRLGTLKQIEKRLRSTLSNLTVSTGIMVVLVMLVAIWMAAALTGKITAIIKGIKRFQAGEMTSRLVVESRDEMGQLAGAFNAMADQLHQSMQGIQLAKERAEESDRAKGLFLANMSHEIRTPMNAILGMSHLALEADSADERRSLLLTVERSAGGLLRLLDDILDFSKMEAGQLQLNVAPFDLLQLLADVSSIMEVPANEKGLYLKITPPTDACCFAGDPLRLRQILLNLINNAIKFTERGGITIETRFEDNAVEAVVEVHFAVIDTGIGIAEDKIDLIFNRFEQADNTYSRQYGGVGLGLSICRQLVALMGGRIWAESRRGEGSTFHAVIPLSPCRKELVVSTPTTPLSNKVSSHRGRILVVDDNVVNRDVARMILGKKHQVACAGNGLEALEHLADSEFDLVFMDVQMPVMDGLAATAIIRAIEDGQSYRAGLSGSLATRLGQRLMGGHLVIIAMTAHALGGDKEMCLKARMDDYITKPFQPEHLLNTVAGILEKRYPADGERAQPPQPAAAVQEFARTSDWERARCFLLEKINLHPDQIDQVLHAAIESLRANLDLAAEAIDSNDLPTLGRAAHTLKGTLLQCGLAEWAEKAQEIHAAATAGKELPYHTLLVVLQQGLAPITESKRV